MRHVAKAFGPILGIVFTPVAIVMILGLSQHRAAAVELSAENINAPSCRAGVTAQGVDQAQWVSDLGAGWYVFFGGFTDVAGSDIQIAPAISVKQDKDGAAYLDTYTVEPTLDALSNLVVAYPGTLWIVGNEVDRGPDPGETSSGQGDTFPAVYARAYNEVYHFIKQHDPSALVANAGLVQVTPGRLQYLDLMWQSYQEQFGQSMPVDVWNMHLYILPEAELDGTPNGIANVALGTDPALAKRGPGLDWSQCALDEIYCFAEHDDLDVFNQQVRAMRRWMSAHGERLKPLILSEFSILYPCDDPQGLDCDYLLDESGNGFDRPRVKNWLTNTLLYLETATDPVLGNPLDSDRLVQQWAWFSVNSASVGDVSNLVKRDVSSGLLSGLTDLGQQYRNTVATLGSYVNLIPATAEPVTAQTQSPGGTVDVVLRASVANNGSLPVGSNFEVTFYADAGLTQVIDQVPVIAPDAQNPGLKGCVLATVPVSVTWSGLSSGRHPYWVKVDSQNDIVELSPNSGGEQDNVAMSVVLIDPERDWLPTIER